MKYPNSYLVLHQLTNYPVHSLTMPLLKREIGLL